MATGDREVSKLFDLVGWVELEDAARHLSVLLGEDVGRQDILRLAMEGQLTLSVRFVAAVSVHCGRAIPIADAEHCEMPTLDGQGVIHVVNGTVIPGADQVIVYADRITTISDVWDLPMIGGERLTVENKYERLLWRDAPELVNLEGTFVTDSFGLYCKIMERFEGEMGRSPGKSLYDPVNFYPASALDDDSVFVLRTKVLREFADRLNRAKPGTAAKPLGSRERATLLTIIAALAKMAKVDVSRPSSAAASIASETERMGARVAARTIENHLKLIPDALEARGG